MNELRVEFYTPPYLVGVTARPEFISPELKLGWKDKTIVKYCHSFVVRVKLVSKNSDSLRFVLIVGGFVTHGWCFLLTTGQNAHQRLVVLRNKALNQGCLETNDGGCWREYSVVTPPNSVIDPVTNNKNLAPPGWYMMFVVENNVPSVSQWMSLGGDPANFRNYQSSSQEHIEQDVPSPGVTPGQCKELIDAKENAEEKKLAEETEKRRLAEQAEIKRLAEEAEKKRSEEDRYGKSTEHRSGETNSSAAFGICRFLVMALIILIL